MSGYGIEPVQRRCSIHLRTQIVLVVIKTTPVHCDCLLNLREDIESSSNLPVFSGARVLPQLAVFSAPILQHSRHVRTALLTMAITESICGGLRSSEIKPLSPKSCRDAAG